MMILSQDGMVAVNSDNVVMFEVKESETLPRETRLCVTMLALTWSCPTVRSTFR